MLPMPATNGARVRTRGYHHAGFAQGDKKQDEVTPQSVMVDNHLSITITMDDDVRVAEA
jgi:hypothetical protein